MCHAALRNERRPGCTSVLCRVFSMESVTTYSEREDLRSVGCRVKNMKKAERFLSSARMGGERRSSDWLRPDCLQALKLLKS